MSCGVGKATEGWRMSCEVGEATERLENEFLGRGQPAKRVIQALVSK